MANPLTGDFDAAVQVSRSTVNRLLATMHQNDGNDAGLPTALHRVVTRFGDVPPPAGSPGLPILTLNIRGGVSAQVGVPTVSFPADAPRVAELSCWIRARCRPDPGTVALPEFIHGRVVARFGVEPDSVGGIAGLRATASPDDAHITFADSGLAGDALEHVSYVIRAFLRTDIDAFLKLPGDLPAGAGDVRTIHDNQNREAIVLPIMLQGVAAATGSVGQVFLGNSDFAVAVSKDFILSLVQPQLDAVKASQREFDVHIKYWGTAHYTVSFTKAEATWSADGTIGIVVEGKATTPPWWAPNVTFGASQDLKLVIHFPAFADMPDLSVVPVGEPDVWATSKWHPKKAAIIANAESIVRAQFISARDAALTQAQPLVSQALARTQVLRDLLLKIDDAAALKWEKSEPSIDGITLGGRVVLSPRKAPRVEFTEIGDDSGYTAFESWVPGGRIKSYRWTWWRSGDFAEGEEVPKTYEAKLTDRYVLLEDNLPIIALPPPSGAGGQPSSGGAPVPSETTVVAAPVVVSLLQGGPVAAPVWGHACLEITGEYIDPVTGFWSGAWAKAVVDPALACSFASPDPIRIWHEKPPGPWRIPPEPEPFNLGVNLLVLASTEREAVAATPMLTDAMQQSGRREAGLVVVLATRVDSRGPSPALAQSMQQFQRSVPHAAVVVADGDGQWLRGLELPSDDSRPRLRLVDPTGRVVWKHDGAADATTVVAALRTHLVASLPPHARLLRQAVRPGSAAPDFAFEYDGRRTRLRRVRGRPVVIAFVGPSQGEVGALLDRLSPSEGESDEPRMLVVVVQDGDRIDAEATRPTPGIDVGLVVDTDGAIGRLYRIQIRPTVLLVDWDGRVSTVQMMETQER